jgi:hypothetical protein
MKKNLLILFTICLLIPAISNGNDNDSLDSYYKNVFLGEKRTSNYFGPLDSRSSFSDENGDLLLLDDQFKNLYLNDQIQTDALNLHDFWFKKVSAKSTCPDITLGANIDYIRYLYRLVTISYLFESIKINHKAAAQLGAGNNICSMSFDDIFGKCKPQTVDMKKFHERVYGKFVNEISKVNVATFNKKELAAWVEDFGHSTSLTLDPVQARLHDWCQSQKKNCRTLSVDDVKNALGSICNNDRDLMQNLCSEKDNLYGISYADKVTDLIQTSNAFNLINHEGMGEECLHRYVKVFSPKEVRYEALSRQFPLIYSHLVRANSRYLQGELFLPGALKEFDMKGLSDFLVALKMPKPPAVVIKVKPAPKAKPVIIVAKAKPVEAPIPAPVQMEIPQPKPKISEFEKTLLELEEKSLESLSINMGNFRDDFEFSKEMMSDLAAPIKKFQTKAALSDMKSYDHLGSAEAPVGLIFLKYLLDTENHQGLFNIISVLGDKFYVNNDIEKKDRPVLIELKNDASTQNHWQIILMNKKKALEEL